MGIVFGKIDVEMPEHHVLRKTDRYEIWKYPNSSVAAAVHAVDLPEPPKDSEQFSNKAFSALAKYIGVFGEPQNSTSEQSEKIAMTAPVVMSDPEKIAMTAPVVMSDPQKIAMTAPVVMSDPEKVAMTAPVVMSDAEKNDLTGQKMKFLLPAKYKTIEEAPKPTNPVVKLEMVDGPRYEAVVSYSGNHAMKQARVKAAELVQALKDDGVEMTGPWTLMGYNPPFTVPFLKRNEVHIPIKFDEAAAASSE